MSGEHDLTALLSGMNPILGAETYVFCTLTDRKIPEGLHPRMVFQEAEGTTLILTQSEAQTAGIAAEFAARMITLNVHSALDAVGFIAHIATQLAAAGMGVNPVAGFYHDHLFIPADRADDAMRVLRDLSR